jgi:hypothetical protein
MAPPQHGQPRLLLLPRSLWASEHAERLCHRGGHWTGGEERWRHVGTGAIWFRVTQSWDAGLQAHVKNELGRGVQNQFLEAKSSKTVILTS